VLASQPNYFESFDREQTFCKAPPSAIDQFLFAYLHVCVCAQQGATSFVYMLPHKAEAVVQMSGGHQHREKNSSLLSASRAAGEEREKIPKPAVVSTAVHHILSVALLHPLRLRRSHRTPLL
jgi:hypothetical protein